jgi:hypothetical protein
MASCLRSNGMVREVVQSLRFHFAGPDSDTQIPILYRCPELRHLSVYISKATTYYASKRETAMQAIWRGNTTRLSDAKGLDELMQVRGLENIEVLNAPVRAAAKRTDDDVWALRNLLESFVLKKKPDGYAETGGS